MDGAHDMGGVAGFGPVVPEPNEPWFHAEWERRAFALTLAMARPGGWNIDMSRFARENRPPQDYLSKSYFEIWLAGLERLMAERELVTPDEIAAAKPLHPRQKVPVLQADDVAPMLRRGAPTTRAASHPARFVVGDRVRAKDIHPPTHTRLPRYVRGHVGVIELVHGAHVFADSNARGAGEDPQWLYTVVFDGRELWGADGEASATISVDAWESYLEPA
ncbi:MULTISPECIES: nitrile hydratase subunit beta [Rhodopseudomonas]|uniref:Nitrile hydratase subunit beta n=1 Tax=Rhodopseudomonas palustris TaxID=1076 RepID=A0A0D7EM60_RHOPL|nr:MULTISPECIES: nitrile hydratase subunit beta [Rhodopseudomonas]KIZ41721.1 nitrile hydratase [Rhodopseudomonas palustris]WOK18986.1 nitrile hydratase subunit beta [Rhodopseudomonas sp. BAL398]